MNKTNDISTLLSLFNSGRPSIHHACTTSLIILPFWNPVALTSPSLTHTDFQSICFSPPTQRLLCLPRNLATLPRRNERLSKRIKQTRQSAVFVCRHHSTLDHSIPPSARRETLRFAKGDRLDGICKPQTLYSASSAYSITCPTAAASLCAR